MIEVYSDREDGYEPFYTPFCDEYGGYVTEEDFCSRGSLATNKTDHPTEKGR